MTIPQYIIMTHKHEPNKTIFVTVGTTSFDALIGVIDSKEFQLKAYDYGFKKLIIQIGRYDKALFSMHVIDIVFAYASGTYLPKGWEATSNGDIMKTDDQIESLLPLEINVFRLKASIETEINSSDLIIGHAGAGTVLDVLRAKKPLILVVNESLMNNHQWELANELKEQNYALVTTPLQFMLTFNDYPSWSQIQVPLPSLNIGFHDMMSKLLGVSVAVQDNKIE